MTPGSRPILMTHYVSDRPDVVMPKVIEQTESASVFCHHLMHETWRAIAELLDLGAPWEYAQYLLPNAVAVRLVESGDLLNLHHKWTTRLCYLAQEEIWRCCREEVEQVSRVCPSVGPFLHAPCGLRKMAGASPYCPEGNRYCGVPVWNLAVADFQRLI
jgi:thymidylate synthase ThyX